jgi:ribonucleoside-diphosphate reductase alpha chain
MRACKAVNHEDELQSRIAKFVWTNKYRSNGEQSVADTWQRVAAAVAAAEVQNRDAWQKRFYELLTGFRFLPGGRILAGAGTGRCVTLFNCFVMGAIDDSLEGIFDAIKEGALTMQRGGGVGYDFSTLRPAGTAVRTTGAMASGPVSFMHIWDAMCETLLSTGSRRGAMMASLRCDHPDIEAFIEAKRDPRALRHFNLSVQVTDAFMEAIREERSWPLVFPAGERDADGTGRVERSVSARELWQKIMRAAYDCAEPGVLFTDTINKENNLAYQEHLTATNPCGEVPLPSYGACDLGSLNLTAFVVEPFGSRASFDFGALAHDAALAVRFLDNVIDVSSFPLPEQAERARRSRRIGLGITGLADALVMLGLRYDSDAARQAATEAMRTISHAAYRMSAELAVEKGAFPDFDPDGFLAGGFAHRLSSGERDVIASTGIRNSHLLAIAPAGTISLLAGNVSSGIEPIFSLDGERQLLDRDGSYCTLEVRDFAWDLWHRGHAGESPPEAFIEARNLDPHAHLEMQAALQPFVDNAISKTVNVAEDFPFDEFARLYEFAWQAGLKGCTAFRENSRRGQVLTNLGSDPN